VNKSGDLVNVDLDARSKLGNSLKYLAQGYASHPFGLEWWLAVGTCKHDYETGRHGDVIFIDSTKECWCVKNALLNGIHCNCNDFSLTHFLPL
jgi:hypothetical protein